MNKTLNAHFKLPHAGFCANLGAAAVTWARLQLLGGILYLMADIHPRLSELL